MDVQLLISSILLCAGVLFFAIGALGLIRLPDALTRMHAAAKTDTLGVGLILLGIIVADGFTVQSAKLSFIIAFLLITMPTATHMIARVAYQDTTQQSLICSRFDLDKQEGDQ